MFWQKSWFEKRKDTKLPDLNLHILLLADESKLKKKLSKIF